MLRWLISPVLLFSLIGFAQAKGTSEVEPILERKAELLKTSIALMAALPSGGHVDDLRMEDGYLVIAGWGKFKHLRETQSLMMRADFEANIVEASVKERPDVARDNGGEYKQAGFEIYVEVAKGFSPDTAVFCLVTDDPELGQYRVISPKTCPLDKVP